MYEQIYYKLFNAITDAVKEIESFNYGQALKLLKMAQIESEERFIEGKPDNIIIIPNERNT